MLRKYVILAVLAGSITFTQAAEPTPEMLGNLKASLQQTCGKGINIQIAELHGGDEGRTVLGLRNNQTGTRDLFISLNENQGNGIQPGAGFTCLSVQQVVSI